MGLNYLDIYHNYTEYQDQLKKVFDENLIVHLHIPKTAGTSFLSIFRNQFKDEDIKSIDWRDIHQAFDDFLTEFDKGNRYKYITGHFRHWDYSKLEKRNTPYKVITFLRHPIERLVSEYRYMTTPVHPLSESFLKDHPTFESFVFSDMVQANNVSKILVGDFTNYKEVLHKMKDRFIFVGLTEYYHLYMKAFMDGLGNDYKIESKKNVTQKTSANIIDIDYNVYNELCRVHSIDIQVYDHLRKLTQKLIGAYFNANLEHV